MALQSITVGELIKRLQDEDEQALVIFSTDYGDRAHTEQAIGVKGELEVVGVTESAYSNSGFAIAESDEDEGFTDADIEGIRYVVIR